MSAETLAPYWLVMQYRIGGEEASTLLREVYGVEVVGNALILFDVDDSGEPRVREGYSLSLIERFERFDERPSDEVLNPQPVEVHDDRIASLQDGGAMGFHLNPRAA